MADYYPLLFEPVLKDYVWGGRSLETILGRRLPPGVTAESWEIAAHPNGNSVVKNGPYTGLTLSALHEILGLDLVGRNSLWAHQRGKFPLLVKILDARERLSVQVHPNDDYALLHENKELGKTEMWVVLHAEPDGSIILGVKAGTRPDRFKAAAIEGNLDQFLNKITVKPGDFICVPSGSLHAILGGLVIAEIQQNSDVTYRVYDWGRQGADRPLHLDKAMEVINFNQVEPALKNALPLPSPAGQRREALCTNEYFTVERWFLAEGQLYEGECDGSTFEIWGSLNGVTHVEGGGVRVNLPAVNFTLLPAALGPFRVHAQSEATLLRIYSK
ncbi:MAG: mannose-6-phosphate isomerase, class I [Anaerolineae bacterium]|nr:MAG: mannose-6-phosphate isomerase, class I [Anaerolineae bacterium]